MSGSRAFLLGLLEARVPPAGVEWLVAAARDARTARDPAAFATTISLASRHLPRGPLAPTEVEVARASEIVPGWNPERWTVLDAARAVLVLSRSDLEADAHVEALEACFRYADVGELVALYRVLALLPEPHRFRWRAGEGCRSSMRVVFEAAACDTPFPFRWFDDASWRQLVVKALFVEAPLWRVHGIDSRLDAELARMALDLAEERRSAGRLVQPELWLTLGRVSGERGRASIERELAGRDPIGRRAASIALARGGWMDRLAELSATERDSGVRATMKRALNGCIQASVFRDFDPAESSRMATTS